MKSHTSAENTIFEGVFSLTGNKTADKVPHFSKNEIFEGVLAG